MKMRVIYLFTFLLVAGAVVYWARSDSFGLEAPLDGSLIGVNPTREETVVVGAIGSEADLLPGLQILAEQIGAQLDDSRVRIGQAVAVSDVTDVARMLRQDRVDIVVGETLPLLLVAELSEADVLLGTSVDGRAMQSSTLFVSEANAFATLESLKGKVIAFPTEDSTVYLLTKAELHSAGFILENTRGNLPSSSEAIGYYFAGGEEEVMQDVNAGVAFAGAVTTYVFSQSVVEDPVDLASIFTSREIPSGLVVIRDGLDGAFKNEAKTAFLQTSFDGQSFTDLASFDVEAFAPLMSEIQLDILNLEE